MTVIIGVMHDGKITMGSDSAMTVGAESLRISAEPKVFKREDMIMGIAGDAQLIKLMKYNVELPVHEDGDDDNPEQYIVRLTDNILQCCSDRGALTEEGGRVFIEGNILVGYKGVLYHLDAALSVTKTLDGVESVGSGCEVALGAYGALPAELPVEERILRAMQVTERYKPHVRAPFHITTL